MELSEIINLVLGGGLMATIVAIITLKSTVKEANAKASKAMAEAETVRIDNTEHATRILIENIVNPLKVELDETRKAMQLTKREMSRLRKAIDTANSCKHHDDCPVLIGLRKQSEGTTRADDATDSGSASQGRQHRRGSSAGTDTAPPDGDGEDVPQGGQPP